jgi:hypothetical protein
LEPTSAARAELGHQLELGAGAARLRHPFEIVERLKRHELQPPATDHAADFSRRSVMGQHVVLKYLDVHCSAPRKLDRRYLESSTIIHRL